MYLWVPVLVAWCLRVLALHPAHLWRERRGSERLARGGTSGDDQGPLSLGAAMEPSALTKPPNFCFLPTWTWRHFVTLEAPVCPRSSPLCQVPSICPPGLVCTLLLPAPAQEADPSEPACEWAETAGRGECGD